MAFTPARVEVLRSHIREISRTYAALLRGAHGRDKRPGRAAAAIVTAEMLGVPTLIG